LVKVYPQVAAAMFVVGAGNGVGRPAERLGCGKGALQGVDATVVDVKGNVITQSCGTNKRYRNGFFASEMGAEIVGCWGTMDFVVRDPIRHVGMAYPRVS
jgi:hypothetical protein